MGVEKRHPSQSIGCLGRGEVELRLPSSMVEYFTSTTTMQKYLSAENVWQKISSTKKMTVSADANYGSGLADRQTDR